MSKKLCEKCKRQMEQTNFYTYKNGQKFGMCKSCLTMHVDNFDQNTFLWILQEADVPYIPQEWNILRDRAYAKDPMKMNGMSVIGKYLSKMKLKQWKQYTWEDSLKLQEQRRKKDAANKEYKQVQQERLQEQFEKGQISEAQFRTLTDAQFQKEHEGRNSELLAIQKGVTAATAVLPPQRDPIGSDNYFREDNFIPEEQLPDPSSQLTLEDKKYLALKWGRMYKPSDWIQLQKKYDEMMQSFDIQDADSKTALIFICKTYLKMNQAIDCGDVQGYQKLSRVYNDLRKSAKFTAAQNKDEKGKFIDSVGQLVAYCQKQGGRIPRYQITTPYDIIDKVIGDLKDYYKNLIYSDTALAKEIEDYIRAAKAAIEMKKDKIEAKQQGYDTHQITEQDTLNFKEFLEQQRQATIQVETEEDQEDELENDS